jgi:hypothetical protein
MPPRTRVARSTGNGAGRPQAAAIRNAARPKPFEFTHDGQTHTLPPARQYMEQSEFDGGAFMDAILDDDQTAELKIGLSILRAASADLSPETYAAIRSKPVQEFLELVNAWIQASGTAPGKS